MKLGFWKSANGKCYMSHQQGLSKEQISYLQSLQIGDRIVLFVNEVREGEKHPDLSLTRSTLPKETLKVV